MLLSELKPDPLEYLAIQEDFDSSIFNFLLHTEFGSNEFSLLDIQNSKLKECLIHKSGILRMETGLGKTFIAVAFLQAIAYTLKTADFFIFCVQTGKIDEFYDLISNYTSLRPVKMTGRKGEVLAGLRLIDNYDADIIICTPTTWRHSIDFCCYLYNNLEHFKGIVYDECKGIDDTGFINFIVASKMIPFRLCCNATPMGKDLKLTYRLLCAIGAYDKSYKSFEYTYTYTREVADHFSETGVKEKSFIDIEKLRNDFSSYYVDCNRADVGAKTYVDHYKLWVIEPEGKQLAQIELQLGFSYSLYCGRGAEKNPPSKIKSLMYSPETCKTKLDLSIHNCACYNQVLSLVQGKPENESIILYSKYTKATKAYKEAIEALGRKVILLTGAAANNPKKKRQAEIEFNSSPGAVIITNTEEGSNLGTAKHMILCGLPTNLAQYIPRAIRGFNDVHINLDIIHYYYLDRVSLRDAISICKNVAADAHREYSWLPLIQKDYTLYYGDLD